jgi:hypothetical protein
MLEAASPSRDRFGLAQIIARGKVMYPTTGSHSGSWRRAQRVSRSGSGRAPTAAPPTTATSMRPG